MRSYIFTQRERGLLLRYLGGESSDETRKIIYNIRRYRASSLTDVKSLLKEGVQKMRRI